MNNSYLEIEKELLAEGIIISLKEGKYLFRYEEEPNRIFYINKGEVLHESKDGIKKKIPILGIYGLRELILCEPYNHSLVTLTEVDMVVVEKSSILSIITKNRKVITQYILSFYKTKFIYE